MIFILAVLFYLHFVTAACWKRQICETSMWILFLGFCVACGSALISQHILSPTDPNDPEVVCMKQGGYVAVGIYKVNSSEYSYKYCKKETPQ